MEYGERRQLVDTRWTTHTASDPNTSLTEQIRRRAHRLLRIICSPLCSDCLINRPSTPVVRRATLLQQFQELQGSVGETDYRAAAAVQRRRQRSPLLGVADRPLCAGA